MAEPTERLDTAIRSTKAGNPNAFRDTIETALASRLSDALDTQKIEIAQSLFPGSDEDSN